MSTSSIDEPLSNAESLMQRFRDGEKEAFKTIFNRYVGRVKAFVLGVIKNEEISERLIEEIFARLFYARASFVTESKIHNWLMLKCRNLVLQHTKAPPDLSETNIEEYVDACIAMVFNGDGPATLPAKLPSTNNPTSSDLRQPSTVIQDLKPSCPEDGLPDKEADLLSLLKSHRITPPLLKPR